MKTKYFLAMVLLVYHVHVCAQEFDNMESYTLGEAICENSWSSWNSPCDAGIIATDEQARSGTQSGMVPGDETTNAIFNLGNKIFGVWYLDFWMYVPSNKEATFNIQGVVPVGPGENLVGDLRFNPDLGSPGEGYIEDTALGQVDFTFPHDQWFRVYMGFDISGGISVATWFLYMNGVEVIPPGTDFKDEAGTTPTSLGGINFRSDSVDHLYYVDDICNPDFSGTCSLGVDELQTSLFTLSPNPVSETLYLSSERTQWETATIYSPSGSIVKQVVASEASSIDVRSLAPSIYFVEITSDYGKEVLRFLKE
ncbi:T9SS type A sorting domain-containing protein [Aureisphaera galaxeae]|uniref:T9SS type A sorting domain-containing protein n=1 Tax=Aureisphaera galaxeae TaxID=1538023 RepID=UPI002350C4AD|nr:T9SS type A sorting domain-containing protein [Aureisphaera galaxeae]MDC8005382.1 T9SS type A sorting domain-containing protein [Aureisphaera galaxeae]